MPAMPAMPRLTALQPSVNDPAFSRGALRQRADQHRVDYDRAAEEASEAEGGSAMRLQTQVNNTKARAMAMGNPEWDEYFQALRDVGGGKPVKIAMGASSPDGSNQDEGPYGAFGSGPATEGPYGPLSLDRVNGGNGSIGALRGRVRPMPNSQDVWRTKTRQRMFGDE